jgi:alpha-tubulin suppressor-like RCC1 family protein
MPLQFPASASLGQTYQSGSSATYRWNGTYWQTVLPPNATRLRSEIAPTSSRLNTLTQAVQVTGSINMTGSLGSGSQIFLNGTAVSLSGSRRTITNISNRGYNNCFIVADGKLFVWGASGASNSATVSALASASYGEYIYGTEGTHEVAFPGESGSIASYELESGENAWVLFDNGNLYYWGNNGNGQAGIGNANPQYLPVRSATNVSKIFAHPSQGHRSFTNTHFFHQKTDGKVYGAGYNGFGQLGLGNTTDRTTWTEIPGIGTNPLGVYPLGAYTGITVIQKSDGSVHACGYNGYGQLGTGTTAGTVNTFQNVTAGWLDGDTTKIIEKVLYGGGYADSGGSWEQTNMLIWAKNPTAGILRGAGSRNWGTLGTGSVTVANYTTPVSPVGIPNVNSIQDITRVGGSPGSIWLLTNTGELWNWGYNAYGQLGRGNTTDTSTAAQVLNGVTALWGGQRAWYYDNYINQSPVIERTDGTYWIAGWNAQAQLADGTTTQRTSFVRMRFPSDFRMRMLGGMGNNGGIQSFAAVDENNKMWVWGHNGYREIYADNTTNLVIPYENTPQCLNY